jgi:hypothetical protein
LQQKAGVAKHNLFRLVLKELTDNGLDEGAKVRVGSLSDDSGYFVEDDGRGIDGMPEEIAQLFSIARPMISTKLLRLPTRGALGNGLRVVAGAVLTSQGSLVVITHNRRIALRPNRDGTTTVIGTESVEFPVGTRIEINLGPAIPDNSALSWANTAIQLANGGNTYSGKTSPWWYDAPQFHELLYARGNTPVRELVAHLDGCTGARAGEIVAAARLGRTVCKDINFQQATPLLEIARENAKPVTPERLGSVGPIYTDTAYARAFGKAQFGSVAPMAEIPFVTEAWACKSQETGKTQLTVCVNRTPVTGEIYAARDKRDIDAFGCGIAHTIAKAPRDVQFTIYLNITTPYMPITSDGKEPDLLPFRAEIQDTVQKAVRKAHRPDAGDKLTQKDVVIDNLDAVIAAVSGGGEFRFNERQLLYRLRPIVMDETGEELKTANFKKIITDYENENDEIPGMYREPRGSIYHPHRGETITLGTLMVENYERPAWTFNKLVYIEKEGFSEALKEAGWAERHDCMLMSSKGFSTRAARDLVDKLAEHDEPCTIFCVHDADAYGTIIYQTFQEATKARGARKVKIVNLGLEPWEAVDAGLQTEEVKEGETRKPVAEYVLARSDGDHWEEWLQTHRVELNAMTTPEFIEWLDAKMAEHGDGKLIPPPEVLTAALEEELGAKIRTDLTERILREAGLDAQVISAMATIKRPNGGTLAKRIARAFARAPKGDWRGYISTTVQRLTRDGGD